MGNIADAHLKRSVGLLLPVNHELTDIAPEVADVGWMHFVGEEASKLQEGKEGSLLWVGRDEFGGSA